MCSWSTLVHGRVMGKHGFTKLTTTQTQGKPPPSPLQYTMCLTTRPTPKCHFVSGLPSGSPEIPKVGTSMTLGAHNFVCKPPIEMKSKTQFSPRQELSNGMSHATWMQRDQGDSQLLVVGSQIANLTFDLSFGHNLCSKWVMRTHFKHLSLRDF